MAGAPVVAEPLPGMQHLLLVRGSQVDYRWKTPQKLLEASSYGGDCGLLQHDFTDPNAVRVAVVTPRQIAPIPVEPSQQSAAY
jgi:hypothetical protein